MGYPPPFQKVKVFEYTETTPSIRQLAFQLYPNSGIQREALRHARLWGDLWMTLSLSVQCGNRNWMRLLWLNIQKKHPLYSKYCTVAAAHQRWRPTDPSPKSLNRAGKIYLPFENT